MSRSRAFLLIPALALVACENPSTAPKGIAAPPPAPITMELTGIVEAPESNSLTELYLRVGGAGVFRIEGSERYRLSRLVGAEVSVHGALDGLDGITVDGFVVLKVKGREAADGVLLQMEEGYALRLVIDGSIRYLIDPPAELLDHVGERVWVTDPTDESPSDYGVIGGT